MKSCRGNCKQRRRGVISDVPGRAERQVAQVKKKGGKKCGEEDWKMRNEEEKGAERENVG